MADESRRSALRILSAPATFHRRFGHMSELPDGVPKGFSRPELEAAGYVGWRSWAQLRATQLAEIPRQAGCYVVSRPTSDEPTFLTKNPAGRFKGKDPTVTLGRLSAEWVLGAQVVYIGKATELFTRLKAFARFGAGEPVAHWGGRLIWQFADADELLVAWRPGSDRELEKLLLARFAELYAARRPFANLTG